MGPRRFYELLRLLAEQLDFPQKYLLLTLDAQSFSQNDCRSRLEDLEIQEGSQLLCAKSTTSEAPKARRCAPHEGKPIPRCTEGVAVL